ncbi:site-2 protease family protein [Clostridiaceae bacterium 14S0207]|nr:site-2 protease family protein [Clostridiaceae bacterium 14S0207]
MTAKLLLLIISIPGILIAFSVHEYAHAKMAYNLGDSTPKFQGRLTLNPIAHVDVIGFLMILIMHFGWAKPVEINKKAFKNPRRDDLKVSIAGPLANLITGIIIMAIIVILNKIFNINNATTPYILFLNILVTAAELNILLFFLNLVPIPGFDGYHILGDLFPKLINDLSAKFESYWIFIFIFLMIPIPFLGNSVFYYIVHLPTVKFLSLLSKFFAMI